MQLYQFNNAELILPDFLKVYQSTHAFGFHNPAAFPKAGSDTVVPEFSIVISCDTISETVQLQDYVEEQMQLVQANVSDFRLRVRQEIYIANVEAVQCEYTWGSGGDVVYQRQAFLLYPSALALVPGTRQSVTITGTTLEAVQSRYETTFQNLLDSLQIQR